MAVTLLFVQFAVGLDHSIAWVLCVGRVLGCDAGELWCWAYSIIRTEGWKSLALFCGSWWQWRHILQIAKNNMDLLYVLSQHFVSQ